MQDETILTLNRLKYLLVTRYQVQRHEIRWESDFMTDLGFSYVQFTSLSMRVEEAFDVKLTPQDAQHLTSVGELVDYVTELKLDK